MNAKHPELKGIIERRTRGSAMNDLLVPALDHRNELMKPEPPARIREGGDA